MPSIVDGLLDAAQKNLGYREKTDGYSKFGNWYYANVDNSDPYFKTAPWCDMFITWAANQAGVEKYVGDFAYTVDHAKWFKEQDAWSDKPEPGAIVFYDWSGSRDVERIDHAGIVEKVQGDQISTIEANVDKVWLKRKDRDQSKVVGYGLPRKVKEKFGEGETFVLTGGNPRTPLVRKGVVQAAGKAQETDVVLPTASTESIAVSGVVFAGVLCVAVVVRQVRRRSSARGRQQRYAGRHRSIMA
ncbi:CHAP domain-containing protein [Nonomuraea sp. NPDC052129]|uniref:CHAP domain-containing protein n=1 Tax=unclassified Nonomuraea TaxID=2593643 RepID=UPI0033EF1457